MGFHRNEVGANAKGGTELMRDMLEQSLDSQLLDNFQIFMSRPRELDSTKIRLIQCHDLAEDPESRKFGDQNFRNSFHKLLFISNWQYQRYQLIHQIPYDEQSAVIETGIIPAPISSIQSKPKDKISIVYTSTPQRGLDIAVDVFEHLSTIHPEIHFDVFSSFKIYGWDSADQQFETLYNRIRKHPKMTYHGFVPNEKLREHLNTAHILAYPSTWMETSCRAMLEAMSAGLVCVHPNYGALAETSGLLNFVYQGDMQDKNRHAQIFAEYLNAAIEFVKSGNHTNHIEFNKAFVDRRYNIEKISAQWNNVLRSLVDKYPTEQSRKQPSQMFVYKTPC